MLVEIDSYCAQTELKTEVKMEQPNSNNAAAPHVNAVNQGEADVGGQDGPITSW